MATAGAKPNRTIRVADDPWEPARAIAAAHGERITDVIVRSLDSYVRSNGYGVDPVTALERLARLFTAGLITDDEWHVKRRQLLDRI